jgi:hypothetical protein
MKACLKSAPIAIGNLGEVPGPVGAGVKAGAAGMELDYALGYCGDAPAFAGSRRR